jgi:hypothetical protein
MNNLNSVTTEQQWLNQFDSIETPNVSNSSEEKFTKKGKYGDYNVEVLSYTNEEGLPEYEVIVSYEGSLKSSVVSEDQLTYCIDGLIECVDDMIEEEFVSKPQTHNRVMNNQPMDLQMISYLQSKVTKVTKRIIDLEEILFTFRDSEKGLSLPDVVTSQAVPNIPHWESELEFHKYKLEWLESQIYYFGEDKRKEESLQRSIEFLKQRGEY